MEKKETWGIPYKHITDFFKEQSDVVTSKNGSFYYKNCHIDIIQLPDSVLGSLCLPKTSVEFSGNPDDLSEIYHRFFMKFLSAGG